MKKTLTAIAILVSALAVSAEEVRVRRPLPPRLIPPATNAVTRSLSVMPRAAVVSAPGKAEIDVLVAYDAFAKSWTERYGGGVTNFAASAVAKMNTVLANSGLSETMEFRLAGITTVDAVGGNDFDGVLTAVSDGIGAWSEVRRVRDAIGADIAVTLIDTGSEYGTTGLSFALVDESDLERFSDYAYSVCAVRAVANSHTMTHEVGHILGAGHSDRQCNDPGPQLYEYSSGYYFTDSSGNPCHTIMAYDDDGYGNIYEECPYFSTPNRKCGGVVVGTAKNDNARTLAATAGAVSLFSGLYTVSFECGAGHPAVEPMKCGLGIIYKLPDPGGDFIGWKCQNNGKLYDGGMLVYNLANHNGSVVMTAVYR